MERPRRESNSNAHSNAPIPRRFNFVLSMTTGSAQATLYALCSMFYALCFMSCQQASGGPFGRRPNRAGSSASPRQHLAAGRQAQEPSPAVIIGRLVVVNRTRTLQLERPIKNSGRNTHTKSRRRGCRSSDRLRAPLKIDIAALEPI